MNQSFHETSTKAFEDFERALAELREVRQHPEQNDGPTQRFPAYDDDQMLEVMEHIIARLRETREAGRREYARTPNVFSNFNRIADGLDLDPEEVLMVYVMKHIDGVNSWVQGYRSQREDVRGRIEDIIVYLTILWAMVTAYEMDETSNHPSEMS